MNISEMRDGFFLVGMQAPRDEGDGRILLGDNAGGGAVKLWPIMFQCGGEWTSI